MTTTTDAMTIVKEIEIEAPAAKVFEALTDAKQRLAWWSDEGHEVERFESDLRVGGTWRMDVIQPRKHHMFGEYRVIEPPTVLEFTWGNDWYGKEWHETIVRFELSERGGTTHLRLTHSGFTDAERYENHDEGWTIVLGWLQRYCSK